VRIGAYLRLFGRASGENAAPGWSDIRAQAQAAERAGFDLVVLEDAALYPDDDGNAGVWEAMTVAAGVAAATERIEIAHGVVNNPYRHPTLVARSAATLDEISGGRYRLGIGLGNTPDDYPRFGIDADRRYSRFAESIQIITDLLRNGRTTFEGEFYQVPGAELVLRGPRPGGIPVIVAAGKPKMVRLAATFADEWNWWVVPGDDDGAAVDDIVQRSADVDAACREVGRDPASLARSVDIFSIEPPSDAAEIETLARRLLAYRYAGITEVRVDIRSATVPDRVAAIEAMAGVVSELHAA